MAGYINDGYTLKGKIPGKGPLPDLNFTYRMALDSDFSEYSQKQQGKTGKASTDCKVAFLAKFIKSWDIEAPLTVDTMKMLPLPVISMLFDYVLGYAVDDQVDDEKN